jgi:transglutaminase-like putative cysteine protease
VSESVEKPAIKKAAKPAIPRGAELAPTDPERQSEPALATLLRFGVYALTAFVFTWTIAVWEGVAGATLGAALASLAGRAVAGSRVRTPAVLLTSVGTLVVGTVLANFAVGSAAVAGIIGPSNALRLGDLLAFGVGAFAIGLTTRTLSSRRRSYAVLEALVIAVAFAQLVVAHRHGAIHRPFALADPILERGGDPTYALIALGGVAAVVLGLLFFSERSALRSLLHLGAAFLLLLVTLVATQLAGIPEPTIDEDVLGGGEGGGGEGEGESDGPEFRDDYDDEHRNEPVAVVLLHDEYSPPSGAYYFRQDAFSEYNGRRMVGTTMAGVDEDVSSGFPAVQPIDVANAPPVGAFRSVVETTVGLIAEHPRPFGLESPVRFMPVTNPSNRFARTYRVRSAVLTSDVWGLVAIGDRFLVGIDVALDSEATPVGTTVHATATGRYSDGSHRDLTREAVWASSIEATAEVTAGTIRAERAGVVEITAFANEVTGSAPLRVDATRLVSLELADVETIVGFDHALTVSGHYADSSVRDVSDRVEWQLEDGAIATIADGSVRGVTAGATTLTATFAGVTETASLTVRDAQLTSIAVSPENVSVTPGARVELEALGTFSDGTTLDLTDAVTWSAVPADLVAIDAGRIELASTAVEGVLPITATVGAVSGAATLTVVARLELGVGDPRWSAEVVAHYTRAPTDPRYAELARRIVSDLPDEYRSDPFVHALAITDYLGANGIYSLRSSHSAATDPTADFLFGDLTGYCVHFAHAAVYLMRSIGLPARVATGYMLPEEARRGGSAMLLTGQWSHAWPEIYVTGVGWVVIDVAPERSLDGSPAVPDEALQQLLAELLRGETPLPFDGSDAPTPFGQMWDEIQGPLVRGLLAALLFVLLAGYLTKLYRQLAPRMGSERERPRLLYRATLDRLASAGLRRALGESPEAFAARLKLDMPELTPLTAAHASKSFGGKTAIDIVALQRDARSVRRGLSRRVPFWRRALGASNPYSWLLTR